MADLSRDLSRVSRRLKSSSLLEPCQSLTAENPPWENALARYLIVRLSPIRDTASSTGHLFLHQLLRSTLGEGVFIDFAFFPSRSDRKALGDAGLPFLFGIFGRRGPEDYSAILISCSYALELVNVPYLLLHSGIPLRARERQERRAGGSFWPILVLGGSNALASQALISPDGDSFVDGIYFGEGEEGGADLLRSLAGSEGLPPGSRALRVAESVKAFWPAGTPVGSGKRVRVARYRGDPVESPPLDSYPILNTEEASTARIQLSWGCPSFCSFCFEGYEHKPYREIPKERILENARRLAQTSGASTLELYSFNFNAHTDALELIFELNRLFERVSMMSQRADLLLCVPGLLAAELAAEKSSFTLGVEGISEGMRSYYSKGLSAETLDRLMARLAQERVRELKLFYMLAGIENEADIAEFASFCARLKDFRSTQDKTLRVLFSFGYLVRMPFTPLRGAKLCLDREAMDLLAKRVQTVVEGFGFEFRLAIDWDEYLTDQYLVLGPHELSGALESAARAGAAFDQGLEGKLRSELEKVLRTPGDPDKEKSRTGSFWDEKAPGYPYALGFLDASVETEFLEARRLELNRRRDTGSCFKGLGVDRAAEGSCLGCGACENAGERNALTAHEIRPMEYKRIEELSGLIKMKRRMRPLYLRAELPETLAGSTDAFLKAYLLKSILSKREALTGRLFRVEEALWASPGWRERLGPGVTGECILALYGTGGHRPGGEPELANADFLAAAEALRETLGGNVRTLVALDIPTVVSVRLRVTLNRSLPDRELRERIRAFLAGLRINATEKRLAAGGWSFEIAPKDAKKRILKSLELRLPNPGGGATLPRLILEGAEKLDIQGLFKGSEDRAFAGMHIESLVLE